VSTHTAAPKVQRRPLRLPAEPVVLAAWVGAGIAAFALAWLAGWATAPERRDGPRVAPIEPRRVVAAPPSLEQATPLPTLRPEAVRRKRLRPRVSVAAPAPPPPPPPAPVFRRPAPPPPPTPVIIVGKG
jgi:hypothetical protein